MIVAVIGAGSWGTALAQVAAVNGHDVRLWARRDAVARAINETHRNPDYLRDADLSLCVLATSSMQEALEGAEAVTIVGRQRGDELVLEEDDLVSEAEHVRPGVVSREEFLEAITAEDASSRKIGIGALVLGAVVILFALDLWGK